jgi:hypothetical protein
MVTLPRVPTAVTIRAALWRPPPRITIRAPIFTREHAHDDDEADNEYQSQDDEGGAQPDAELRGHGRTLMS